MNPTGTQPTASPASAAAFDAATFRRDFPILDQRPHGKPLVYLDSAATSQKPQAVIDAVRTYYETANANVHRGVYALAEQATQQYESVRRDVADFLGAARPEEIVFTRGTTDAINLVAGSWGRQNLRPGDEVLITHMEHHSNIVPWQLICEQTGAVLRVCPIDDHGELLLPAFDRLLGPQTRLVAFTHVSNSLGTINPVSQMCEKAHRVGAVVLVDGAQAVPHLPVNVQDLACDFYAFSGHKIFGPTGTGVLYGRHDLLESMPPYQGGGDMIMSVTFEKSTWNEVPFKFEAGTPNVAGIIGLGAALRYFRNWAGPALHAYEADLLAYATNALAAIPGLTLVGTAAKKTAILSFVLDGIHPYDMSPVLDHEGVAVRTGHHCTQPVMDRFGLAATVRASLAPYNTQQDIDALVQALAKVRKMFANL